MHHKTPVEEDQIFSFPVSRLAAMAGAASVAHKHFMYALLEIDVTELRHRIRTLYQQGRSVSFTASVVKATSDSVATNRGVQAIQRRPAEVVVFRNVDVVLPVEKHIAGYTAPVPLIIRDANTKSVDQIIEEITCFCTRPVEDERS